MLFKRLSLLSNLLLLIGCITLPFVLLGIWLLATGRMTVTTLVALLSVLATDMALVALFARGLIQPVRAIRTALDDTARGNGTAGVANPYEGDLGEMINEMNGALRSIGDTLSSLLYESVHVVTAHLDMIIATESRLTEENDASKSGEPPKGQPPDRRND